MWCVYGVCACVHACRFMARKLYALALGRCAAESEDSPSNQEVLLGGHLYLMVLKVMCFLILPVILYL